MTRRLRWLWQTAAVTALAVGVAAPTWSQGPQSPNAERPGREGRRMPGGGPGMGRSANPPLPGRPGATAAGPRANAPTTAAPTAAITPSGKNGNGAKGLGEGNKLEWVELKGGAKVVSMDFRGLGLDHFLRFLATHAGVTIIRDPGLDNVDITVICPQDVSLDTAFEILNSILQSRDFTLTRWSPMLYKVQPIARAVRDHSVPLRVGTNPNDLPQDAQLVTQFIPLKNLPAQEVAGEVNGMLSQGTTATLVPSMNALIITDTRGNINKVLQVIEYMEGELPGIRPIRLRYRDASEIGPLLQSVVLNRGGGGGGAVASRPVWERRAGGMGAAAAGQAAGGGMAVSASGGEFIFPDYQTNTLYIQATPLHFKQIEELVESLDRPVDLRNTVYIYPVQNLMAGDLAALVAPCVGAQVTVVQRGTGGTGGTTGRTGTTGQSRLGRQSSRLGGGTLGGGGYSSPWQRNLGVSGAPAPSTTAPSSVEVEPLAAPSTEARGEPRQMAQAPEGMPLTVAPTPPVPVGDAGLLGGGDGGYSASTMGMAATITADETTNTLLIMAPPAQLEMMKSILDKLDVMPPQVYIQAIIAEVRLTKDNSLGVQWSGLISQLRSSPTASERATGTFSNKVAVGDSGLLAVIKGPGEFQATLNALVSDTNAKVLSTPSIFTANNQPATINVSNQRPYPVSTITTTNGDPTVLTQVGTQDVGIVLNVTPRVTQGDVVQMEVGVQASDAGDAVNIAGQSYPTVMQRQAESVVNVPSGQTVVLGGLMRDTVSHSSSGIPILSQIPIVGHLFKSKETRRDKTELLVFLTPRVVRSAAEAQHLSETERDKLSTIPRSLDRPLDQTGLEEMEADRLKERKRK